MDQVMLVRPRVEEARREICRAGRRCGYCRVYPGPREVCEERGRAVQANSRPCRAYDQVTPEELAEFKEEMAEKQRAYYLAHKEEMAEKQRAYRLAHKEEMAEKKRAYYLAHKEEMAEKKRAYYLAHKEEMAEKQRAYYLAHKEEMAEKQRAKKTELRNALKAIEKLKVVDPELYKQLIEETQK